VVTEANWRYCVHRTPFQVFFQESFFFLIVASIQVTPIFWVFQMKGYLISDLPAHSNSSNSPSSMESGFLEEKIGTSVRASRASVLWYF
jgi:hypothetical protein